MQEDSFFFTSSPKFIICRYFDDGHLISLRWYLIAVLICISLILVMLSIFSCALWPCVYLLWKNVYLDLLFFFNCFFLCCILIYWGMWAICIFWRSIPYQSDHLQIFSLNYLLVVFMVLFVMKVILHLIRFHLFIPVFISITLGDQSKKRCCCDLCQSVMSTFSSRNFIVSSLIFISLIHLTLFLCIPSPLFLG